MQSGDTFTDAEGSGWVLDRLAGRGSWGETWILRGDEGAIAVLKVPLLPSHFPDAEDAATLSATCTSICTAHKNLLSSRKWPFLPELRCTAVMDDGREGLVLRHYNASLEDRLVSGFALSEVLDLTVQTLHQLANGQPGGVVHGNLRPSNILVDDDGRVILSDCLVDVARPHRESLADHALGRADYLPPEAGFHPASTWDTWAIACMLVRACSAPTSSDDPRRGTVVPLPSAGLDKLRLASVKDGAAARLRAESANPRFSGRATDKLGAVLNRALSAETDPSPPYRFQTAVDLRARLVEIDDLIHPAIETASRVVLGSDARDGVFVGGEEVAFSVNVGATVGVTGHEDIAIGVNLRDLDAPGDGRVRVTDSRFHVDRYPSGRWRFNFVLPDVPPGRYSVRVAFAVKGSESAPTVAEGGFEVRPRPGYVPPPTPADAPPPPIQFPKTHREPAAEPVVEPEDPPAPSLLAPAPVAPMPAADPVDLPDTVVSEPVSPRAAPLPSPVAAPVAPPPAPVPAPPAAAVAALPAPEVKPGPLADLSAAPPLPESTDTFAGTPEPPPLPDIPSALQDYPFPDSAGADLPGYDGADSGPSGPLDALQERLAQMYEGDPWSAIVFAVVVVFILVVASLQVF